MTDQEYFTQAVLRGHLCPKCENGFLRFGGCVSDCEGARCEACYAHYYTFLKLFTATQAAMGWPDDAWARWLEAHPDYVRS